MVQWKEHELTLIQQYRGQSIDKIFSALPENLRRYKCHTCHYFFEERFLYGSAKQCPVCGEDFKHLEKSKMCPIDHNTCHHEVMGQVEYCPICGDAICPECGTHDVLQISRVTGYLQDVSGWNKAKRQELKDRTHYSVDGATTTTKLKTAPVSLPANV